VVVQGPPGTGKTHTIANIVSHYLALGKRVLVTSQKAPALKVLRDKLPAGVRPLAVSLLESDREGLQQFQDSVDEIAARLQRIKPRELRQQIADLDRRIELIHAELAGVDRKVDDLGRAGLASIELDGMRVPPVEAARALAETPELADWLADAVDVIRSHDPGFDDQDIAALREARKQVGDKLTYIAAELPAPETLPDPSAIEQLHEDLSEAEQLERATSPAERLADGAAAEALALAKARLETVADARRRAEETGRPWIGSAFDLLRKGGKNVALHALEGLAPRIAAGCAEARHFLTLPVSVPEGSDEREFRDPITNLSQRGELGIFTALFARQVKQRIGAVRIAGRAPNSAEDWAQVKRYLEARDAARELTAIWNHAASGSILAPVPEAELRAPDGMQAQLDALALVRRAIAAEQEAQSAIEALLPHWSKPVSLGLAEVTSVIDRHLRRTRLAQGRKQLASVQASVATLPGDVGTRLRTLAHDRLGRPNEAPEAVARDWRLLVEELAKLRALTPAFRTIRSVADEIAESGAPN